MMCGASRRQRWQFLAERAIGTLRTGYDSLGNLVLIDGSSQAKCYDAVGNLSLDSTDLTPGMGNPNVWKRAVTTPCPAGAAAFLMRSRSAVC